LEKLRRPFFASRCPVFKSSSGSEIEVRRIEPPIKWYLVV